MLEHMALQSESAAAAATATAAVVSGLSPAQAAAVAAHAASKDRLLSLPFNSVADYLFMLRAVSCALGPAVKTLPLLMRPLLFCQRRAPLLAVLRCQGLIGNALPRGGKALPLKPLPLRRVSTVAFAPCFYCCLCAVFPLPSWRRHCRLLTLPLHFRVFHCRGLLDTAFASCVPLPSWLRHCLCYDSDTARPSVVVRRRSLISTSRRRRWRRTRSSHRAVGCACPARGPASTLYNNPIIVSLQLI